MSMREIADLSDAIGKVVILMNPSKAKLVGWDKGTNEITVVMRVETAPNGRVRIVDYQEAPRGSEPTPYPPKDAEG